MNTLGPAKAGRHVRRASNGLTVSAFALALAAAVTACATNPATGKRQFSLMSEEQEIAAGQQNDVEVRR